MTFAPSLVENRNEAGPPGDKEASYRVVTGQLSSVLHGEHNRVAKMATINCLLREALPYYFWTGFYLVEAGELVVGPYQGTLGCLRISFGQGVCGTAALTGKTQVVPDVRNFPGHIACDSRSRSEIVVPVFDEAGTLIAVFDVDSAEKNSFDEIDQRYLENIIGIHFAGLASVLG